MRTALGAIALLAYANSFGLGLALDGRRLVKDDTRIRAVTAENLGRIATTHYWWPLNADRLYRPVTTASYLLNYALLGSGENPAGYHVLNFLLHVLNVWLVFELAMLLLRSQWPAFFAAAIWGAHPAGTEAVANVAGRADLLGALAVLGGLLLFLRTTAWNGRRLVALFAISMAGLLSKENAAVLIGLMLLGDVAFGEPDWLAALRRHWPAYAAVSGSLAIFLLLRQRIFADSPPASPAIVDNPLLAAGFWSARLTAIKLIGIDLKTLLWPANLSFDHSYNEVPIAHGADWGAWLALLIILAILALVIARFRHDRLLFWCAGFFGITLLPTSNLMVLIGAPTALRFLYLPSVAAAIAAAALAYRLKNQRAATILLSAAVLLCCVRTFARNTAWDSDFALASADVTASPNSYRVHHLLAESLSIQDPQNNLNAAIREEEAAWAILQPLPPAWVDLSIPANLGKYYYQAGSRAGGAASAQGRAWYQKSLAVLLRAREAAQMIGQTRDQAQVAAGRPLLPRIGFDGIYFSLGTTYASLGQPAEAMAAFRAGRAINPHERAVYDELATLYAAQGDLEQAAILLDEKAHLFGLSSATLGSLRNLYGRIPGGECAIDARGALNFACPRLQRDMCMAWADLAKTYTEARFPDRAQTILTTAASHGCKAD